MLRQEGTEPPFSSPLNNEKRQGTFVCAGCQQPLFASSTKFDSGTGWPSFWQPLPDAIDTQVDFRLIIPRTEYHCRRCVVTRVMSSMTARVPPVSATATTAWLWPLCRMPEAGSPVPLVVAGGGRRLHGCDHGCEAGVPRCSCGKPPLSR